MLFLFFEYVVEYIVVVFRFEYDPFRWCSDSEHLDRDYHKTWASLPRMFGTEPYKYLNSLNIL